MKDSSTLEYLYDLRWMRASSEMHSCAATSKRNAGWLANGPRGITRRELDLWRLLAFGGRHGRHGGSDRRREERFLLNLEQIVGPNDGDE